MRKGGGKEKGSAFEREVGYMLSRWVTGGTRKDVFCRTVLSGGQFTNTGSGNPGDLMAQDPLAQVFCDQFIVECKHWQHLDLLGFYSKKGMLFNALLKVDKQGSQVNKDWFFVVRQNWHPVLLMTPRMPYHRHSWPCVSIPPIIPFTIVNLEDYLGYVKFSTIRIKRIK